ncbi:MAG: CRISPR-associated endonuclease Cas1 [Gemmataceae bacterium]|nr:CRISPR-associated endonuclease Cas1 [Gemmata sp.]MDW8197514.1 CRISPR-associated endonuclease Cas1 [Gemmataceae bacterium]
MTAWRAPVAHLVGPGVLNIRNGRLVFQPPEQAPLQIDASALTNLYCYGDVSISGPAFEVLFRHGVAVAWLSPAGHRCRGRLVHPQATTTLTRLRQHRAIARPAVRLQWAQQLVTAKITAMIHAARHYQRHSHTAAGDLLVELHAALPRVATATALPQLLGFEGATTAAWFRFYATLFRTPWTFHQRTRRPPTDPVNALLSLGYTLLLQRAQAQAEARGFEIYLGGLHHFRPGRPSLACDLIEPLRVPAVDRWVVAICNQHELNPSHFQSDEETGGFRLQPQYFGRIIYSWETHWAKTSCDTVLAHWLDQFEQLIQQSGQLPASDDNESDDL